MHINFVGKSKGRDHSEDTGIGWEDNIIMDRR
jgi:hypothetical protein